MADSPDTEGYYRRGKVFTLRLSDEERKQLETLELAAEPLMPWERRRSLGGFMVWAALQWKPPGETKPRNGRDVDGTTVYRNGVAVARRVATTPTRAGNTGRPGGRRAKAKAKGKKARR